MKQYLPDLEATKRLMAVALGNEAADLAVTNARLVNVYSGEIQDGQTVCVSGRWIAAIGSPPKGAMGRSTRIIDAAGRTLIPGLIDGHTHLAWLSTPARFLEHTLPGGTTTMITETLEIYPVAGAEGLEEFLQAMAAQPFKLFATIPMIVSISPNTQGLSEPEARSLSARDEIIGTGEIYWQGLLQKPDLHLPLLQEAMKKGKLLEGHTAGASEAKLNAYVAAGISSCHEPIDVEQVLSRLRLGLHVMVREGSIRSDLEVIAGIRNEKVDLRRLILASDGLSPADLTSKGGMEHILQKAIDYGFDPVTAIQMATLNVAEHFRLDGLVGGISPGRCADMVLIPEPETIQAEMVISEGRVVAEKGNLLVEPVRHRYSPESLHSISLRPEFKPEDFRIPVHTSRGEVKIRGIDMVTPLVTRELLLDIGVSDEEIRIDTDRDISKVAAVDRRIESVSCFTGIIRGFGLRAGAVACSTAWDSADIVVVGADDSDMALAINRLCELQGGAVICSEGSIEAEVPMPIFGLMTDIPLMELAEKLRLFQSAAADLGISFPDPLLTLSTLTCSAIPFIRICEEGLFDLREGKPLGLFVES